MHTTNIEIPIDRISLKGNLTVPEEPLGIVLFSHGSGSSRLSPRNRFVANKLQHDGFATLLFDLLTPQEDTQYERRFDIELLTQRLTSTTHWLQEQSFYKKWNIGYFGASTGAASALKAAAQLGPQVVKAIVSRGGRPDLAMDVLDLVKSPTLLVVGGLDTRVIQLNERVFKKLKCTKQIQIIEGATHLFEEPGTLQKVTEYASDWFTNYLHRYQIEIDKDYLS